MDLSGILETPHALDAQGVCRLLGLKQVSTFYNKRATLEAAGFPPKLPGLARWSRPAIMAWLEMNGRPSPEPKRQAQDLEGRYGQ